MCIFPGDWLHTSHKATSYFVSVLFCTLSLFFWNFSISLCLSFRQFDWLTCVFLLSFYFLRSLCPFFSVFGLVLWGRKEGKITHVVTLSELFFFPLSLSKVNVVLTVVLVWCMRGWYTSEQIRKSVQATTKKVRWKLRVWKVRLRDLLYRCWFDLFHTRRGSCFCNFECHLSHSYAFSNL